MENAKKIYSELKTIYSKSVEPVINSKEAITSEPAATPVPARNSVTKGVPVGNTRALPEGPNLIWIVEQFMLPRKCPE